MQQINPETRTESTQGQLETKVTAFRSQVISKDAVAAILELVQHAEILEREFVSEGGMVRFNTLFENKPELISSVMQAVQQFRLPLINHLLGKAIKSGQPIAGWLLRAKLNAMEKLPIKFRSEWDIEHTCQACLNDAFNGRSDETAFSILDAVHQLPVDRQASLLIQDGSLYYPKSTRYIDRHFRTQIFLKMYALMHDPVLSSVYNELKLRSKESGSLEVNYYHNLLECYGSLKKLTLQPKEQSIALGIQSLINASGIILCAK